MSHWNPFTKNQTLNGWDYRVVYENDIYDLVECYYFDDGTVAGWMGAATISGDSLGELKDDLIAMRAALDKPVLTVGDC